jgi:hypothetical protein
MVLLLMESLFAETTPLSSPLWPQLAAIKAETITTNMRVFICEILLKKLTLR